MYVVVDPRLTHSHYNYAKRTQTWREIHFSFYLNSEIVIKLSEWIFFDYSIHTQGEIICSPRDNSTFTQVITFPWTENSSCHGLPLFSVFFSSRGVARDFHWSKKIIIQWQWIQKSWRNFKHKLNLFELVEKVCKQCKSSEIWPEKFDSKNYSIVFCWNCDKKKYVWIKMKLIKWIIQGTPRRKKKIVHQTAATDDKKLQSTLKKLAVNNIPGIEEVNLIKNDGTVIHFNNPKTQASLASNVFAITGHGEQKQVRLFVISQHFPITSIKPHKFPVI